MRATKVGSWNDIEPGGLQPARIEDVDLVVIKWPDGEGHSVLYGRCVHRGALMADGRIEGGNIVCGLHAWDYRYDTGISSYRSTDVLPRFTSWVEDGAVWVDADELAAFTAENPQPFDRDAYQGSYQDPHGTTTEPYVGFIRELASHGLAKTGHHGQMGAMGVPRGDLPSWDDIQILTAQLEIGRAHV